MRQPVQQTGALAAQTLIDMIHYPSSGPRHILLPTELVIRSSCGSPYQKEEKRKDLQPYTTL
jgi:DNA-binding LacI/PurR family transcriptional regulator